MRRWRWFFWIALLLAGSWAAFGHWHAGWLEHHQDGSIRAAARRYGVEPALIKAVVWRESRFHPDARGRAGELGLMQLRDDAAREWAEAEQLTGFTHEQCLDPITNTLAGAWYVHKL